MAFTPGDKLGPYEIVGPLGAGGMGEVWRARDPRLARDVAIKALPAAFSQDPERLARFEREAKLLASLSHPTVAGIFGLEDAGGSRYLVLEFVDGETLEARIARGALPLDEALDVAHQVAAGVEAAHEAGVVHRDLKPGNIMLTGSGAVKVLDFGLAKGGSGKGSDSNPNLSASPTMTYAATQAGVILGTAAYMSPEQARGKAVDRRTDIWSFGCVLFEMLTGKRTYDGETVSDMVARILEREPAWDALPLPTPPRLVALLRRCLTKDARQRQRDMGDVRLELDAIGAGDRGVTPATPRARSAGMPPWALAAGGAVLLALGVLAASWLRPGRGEGPAPLVRFTLTAPAGWRFVFPDEAQFSPDGATLACALSDSGGIAHLALRSLSGMDMRILPGTDGAALPFWSPDGRSIGFFASGKLRRVGMDGGTPVDLCDAPDARGGAWSPRGVIVFAPRSQGGLMRVPEGGGIPVPVTAVDTTQHERGHRYPQFLPDGRHFLFVAVGSTDSVRTFAASLDGGRPAVVCSGGSDARFASPDMLLYLGEGVKGARRRLLAQRFDPGRLRTIGDPEVLIDPVSSDNFGFSNVSTGPGGRLVVQHVRAPRIRLAWRGANGTPAGAIPGTGEITAFGGALSPDGRRFAYSGEEPRDVFVLDMATGVSTRLTFEDKLVNSPLWSPDGRRIAFNRVSEHGWDVHVKNSDGSGPDSMVFRGPALFAYADAWSPDGNEVLGRVSDAAGNLDLWRIPMTSAGHPESYQHTPEQEVSSSISADGHWISYTLSEQGQLSLYVQSYPHPGGKYQVAVDDLGGGGWLPVASALLAVTSRGEVLRIDALTADGFHQGATTRLFRLSHGEQVVDFDRVRARFLVSTPVDLPDASTLEVVLGWPRLLDKH